MQTRFPKNVEAVLRGGGWYPGRSVADLVAEWKQQLERSDGFQLFPKAEESLLEFGGLYINQQGPGNSCAREPFRLLPTLAMHERDRFTEHALHLKTRLYPLGEAAGGHYFIAIAELGQVYLLMQDILVLGEDIDEAIQRLILGISASPVSAVPNS